MRISELNAQFVGAGGEGVFNADMTPAAKRTGVGVMMRCPCGKCDRRLFVPFKNPIDGGAPIDPTKPGWTRTGDTIDTLTLSPSIHRMEGCRWHGFIENGAVRTV